MGAMDELISDKAQAEISNRVSEVLQAYIIKGWQSEPHYHNQNYAERGIQDIKRHTNWVLNTSGAPPFLAIRYVAYVLNQTASTIHPRLAYSPRSIDWPDSQY